MNKEFITNVVIEGIDYKDAPDFVDAYIASADYDGVPMDDEQLDHINCDDDFVHQQVLNHIY